MNYKGSQGDSDMFTPVRMRLVNSYKSVGLETSVSQASPHHLVAMLFEALIQSLNATKEHLKNVNFEAKGQSVGRAVRILEEGLKAALDMKGGGEIAANLRSVYDYCIFRLTEANLRNDAGMIDEVIKIIRPIADGWSQIRAEGADQQRAA
jgi:flagellar protein FliS